MPLPLLVPIVMGIASAAGAIGSFVKGKSDMNRAKHKVRMSEENLEKAQKSIENKRKKVESAANELGSQKVEVYKYLRNEFIPFYKKYKNVNFNPGSLDQSISILPIKKIVDKLDTASINFLEVAQGALGATGTGAAASLGAYALAGTIGTASTGTAIASLSGAAATNATLAWLGGGSLAAGGAGMVGGALVLGGIGAPIALLGGGLLYAHKAAKTLTDAVQYEADVDEFVANSKIIKTYLGGMELRVKELLLVTVKLESRLKKLVEDFKSEYPDKNYPFFLKFLLKIKNNRMKEAQKNKLIMIGISVDTLNLVLTAPLLNDSGKASDESLIAIEKAEYLIKDV